jgi:hypothetical protein
MSCHSNCWCIASLNQNEILIKHLLGIAHTTRNGTPYTKKDEYFEHLLAYTYSLYSLLY